MKPINLHSSTIFFQEEIKLSFNGSVLIVTDENIAPLYLSSIQIQAREVFSLILPSGEESKNFAILEQILEYALKCNLDRKSTMIALGGGVISDLVGLASGLFMRGIDFYSIPTTLLAQVDASVGGKCAINSQKGKNLIGLFHHPKQVFINPYFLTSLPQREFNAGMAEVIKMAICFDQQLFEMLFDIQWVKNNLLAVIQKSIQIKANIVLQDEKETNIRAALNYGHTFGHIIEQEGNYQDYLHGEAVAMGMVMANALASKITHFQDQNKVIELLSLYHLPTHYKIKDIHSFYQAFFLDKKTQNKQIKFILPKKIGDYDFFIPSKEDIMKTLSEFAK